jgi:RNA-directed DNA polymerase
VDGQQIIDQLDAAYEWLRKTREDASIHQGVWDIRRHWPTVKAGLITQLTNNSYHLSPLKRHSINGESFDVWEAIDSLVIKATALAIEKRYAIFFPISCTHVKGHKDVCERIVWTQGYYETVKDKSIPRGCSLSPLLAAIYLMPLDHAMKNLKEVMYVRFMDDYVFMTKSKVKLRKAIKAMYEVLGELKLDVAKDKTFIGRVARGFSFLGYDLAPGKTRASIASIQRCQAKTAKLQEKGASNERLSQYLQNWQRWLTCQPLSLDAIIAPGECLLFITTLIRYASLGALLGQIDFFVKMI